MDWDTIVDGILVIAYLSTVIMIVCSMASMGLSLTIKQIATPLKNWKLVILALVASFVIVPLVAYVLVWLLPLEEGYANAVYIFAFAAGAPFIPALAKAAKGDAAFSVGLTVLLMVVTIFLLPIILPFVIEGATINAMDLAGALIVLMLIPLGIALWVRSKWEAVAIKWAPHIGKVSSITLIILIVTFLIAYIESLIDVLGSTAILCAIVFYPIIFFIGYVLGGSKPEIRSVMGMATAQRNVGAGTAVAAVNFADTPDVMVMIIVMGMVGLVILFGIAGRLAAAAGGVEEEAPTESGDE